MRPSTATLILWLVYGAVALLIRLLARFLSRELPWRDWLLFAILPIVFLSPGFFGDRTSIPLDHVRTFPPWNSGHPHPPYNPSLSDVVTQFAPWAKAVRMAWKEGSLPFWNRWNGGGMPLAANGQSQAFSPFMFLTLALPLARSFVLLAAAKLLVAATGTYLWLLEFGVSRAAARFAAITFAFSFALTPWLYHPATAVICVWPWVFFGLELAADSIVRRRGFLLLIGVLAAWPLCGHLETVALGGLFGLAWIGLRGLTGDLPRRRSLLLSGALAAILALGLSAFLLLPQLHAIRASNRLVLANDPRHLEYVPWVPYKPGWLGGFVTSFFPLAYGDLIESPMISGAAGSIVEMGFGYFGILGWCLALLVLRPGSRRGAKEWILLAMLLAGLLGAMGLPPMRLFFEALPGIGLAPPLRLLLFASAAGVPLAAMELDRLMRDFAADSRGPGFLLGISAGIAAFALIVFFLFRRAHAAAGGLAPQTTALYWTLAILFLIGSAAFLLARRVLPPAVFLLAVTLLSGVELLHQGMRLYRFYSPRDLYPETPLIHFLRKQSPPFRIVGAEAALFPDTNVFASAESVATHDPAERRDFVRLLDIGAGYPTFEYFKVVRNLDASILDFLNVRFLVSSADGKPPGPRWIPVYTEEDGRVFENREALPRLYAPRQVEVVRRTPSDAPAPDVNALTAFGPRLEEFLKNPDFAGRALILQSSTFPQEALSPVNPPVRVGPIEQTTNTIRFSASSQGPSVSVLVSSLVTDGGWSASDELGNPLGVTRVNGPFLAVLLPAGDHLVTLRYVPPGFRLGVAISVTTLAALALRVLLREKGAKV